MYLIPLAVLFFLALVAVAWNPIFALLVFVVFMVGFFAYIGLSRRSDEGAAPADAPSARDRANEEETGLWGERRPQE